MVMPPVKPPKGYSYDPDKYGSLVEDKGLPLVQNIRKMPPVKPPKNSQEGFVDDDLDDDLNDFPVTPPNMEEQMLASYIEDLNDRSISCSEFNAKWRHYEYPNWARI